MSMRLWARRRRLQGETHAQTLATQWLLADVLVHQNKLDEAREIRDRWLPVVRRVLGPDHRTTLYFGHPDFLDPLSERRYQI